MSTITIGLLGLVALILVFFTGIELALGMAIVGFIGFASVVGFKAASNLLVKDFFDTFSSYGFTVIPLFILMGQIASTSNIAKRIYLAAHKFVGHVPGGLAMTTVLGATAFKAICGSSLATVATFTGLAMPEMDRYGYNRKLATGVIASSGALGLLIPPNVVLILYGLICEQSIGKLFLAGILPALLAAFLFMVVIYGWVKIDPSIVPISGKASWTERRKALPEFLAVAVIFFIIMGGLMFGLFSPTEAGTMGTVAVLVLAALRKEVNLKMLINSIDHSIQNACMILILVWGSVVLGHFLAVTKIPFMVADWVVGLPLHRSLIIVLIIFVYLIGGSFIDDIAFMILATPIFYPPVMRLGYDPLWFAVIIGLTLMIGVIIPPVALNVFVIKNLTGIPFGVIYRGVVPFLAGLVVAIVLVFLFPGIATWLPYALMGK